MNLSSLKDLYNHFSKPILSAVAVARGIAAEKRDESKAPLFKQAIQDKNRKSASQFSSAKPSLAAASGATANDSSNNLRDLLPILGYATTSTLHAFAGLNNMLGFLPKAVKQVLDPTAVWMSKMVTSVNYLFVAMEAWKNNEMFDFIARILDPLVVPWMNLEDIHLARGLSAGMTQIDNGQRERVGKHDSKWENLVANFKAFGEVFKENASAEGVKRLWRIFTRQEEDSGHYISFTGYLICLGSLVGVLGGANKRNIWNKIGGVMRNFGGFIGDFAMMLHPDPDNKTSGAFYSVNAVVDAMQRFLPENVIDTVNHFNMILNNIGTYFFAQLTRKKSDGTFQGYDISAGNGSSGTEIIVDPNEKLV